ncbi:MAG: M43 family zinc metalloprotease [Bacteroidia bacterium]
MKVFFSKLFCLFLIGITHVSVAQHGTCGTDNYIAEILKTNPQLLKSITDNNEELSKLNGSDSKLFKKGVTRTIPVVFHIIHAYGPENISKEQIEDQMRIMNEAFQRMNADTTSTRSIFKGVAADMDIEFKLARKDPNGNCTEGITRTFSYLTDGGDDDVKNLIRWDYTKYLNIWVIKNIVRDAEAGGRVLGYATLPAFTNSTSDGIVMLADYVGNKGTSANNGNKGRVLVHEAGHWLGLYHPFQGGCGGGCSNSGDYVCDTPPVDEPSFGCPTTNNTCINDFPDQVDMVENFMDYANGSCQNMFTKGQKAVVDNALSKSPRNKNITTANHTATGIFTSTSCAAVADFNTSTNIVTICQGGTVNFKDYSYNGTISTYEWSFDGGTPSTSALSAPAIVYANAGHYKVTLKVTNAQGSNTKVVDKMINVVPSVSNSKTPMSEGFEDGQILIGNWNAWETGDYGWKRITTTKYAGTAAMVATIDAGTAMNSVYNLVSSPYDLSVIKDRLPKLKFLVAYRPAITGNTEILTISVTTDCGQTWKPLKAYSNATGLGVDNVVESGWKPTQPSHWKELSLDLKNYETSKNLMIKFEARSRSGNSIYLDNVSIQADLVSIGQLLNPNTLAIHVYPNPSKGSVNIDIETEGRNFEGIEIYNLTGQAIENGESDFEKNGSKINYTVSNLAPGIYLAQIKIEGQLITKKFVIIP